MSFDQIDIQWFAAEDEGRTEDPSEYKLKKAREEGRVAKSHEFCSAFVFLMTVTALIFFAKYIVSNCTQLMKFFFVRCTSKTINFHSYAEIFFRYFFKMIIPISVFGIIAGFAANIIQNKGMIFSLKPIEPKFSKIIPKFGEYFKNTLFSMKGAFNVIKSIGKVVIIAVIAYVLLRKDVPILLMIIQNGTIIEAAGVIAGMAAQLLLISAIVFLIISIPDYFVNKREFMESMKMTKYEVKQEYKEMEGDPEIKNRLKQEQRRILQQNIPKAVKESDVVITNPTHFAVSMKYDRTIADSPKITAKGADSSALYMRRIAQENGIPVVENRPLARGLYTDTEVGDIIPEKYLAVLANVYAEIMKYSSKKY